MVHEENFIECMNNDFPHFKISKTDLTNPTHGFVVQYYSMMLEHVMRVSTGTTCNFTEGQRELVQSVPGNNCLMDHFANGNLYLAVKYIFDQIGIPGFHYSEIMFPFLSPKRSFVFMASLYEFYSSCAEFDETYEHFDNVEVKRLEITKLQHEQTRLREEIALNAERRATFAASSRELKKRLEELMIENDKKQVELKKLQHEEEVHLEKLQNLEEHEKKMQSQFIKVEEEKKYFESLIVTDDSQILDHHRKLEKKKDESFAKLRDLEEKVHEGSSKVNQFATVLSLYDSLNTALRGEVTVGTKRFDLKGLHNAATSLKKEGVELKSEDAKMQILVKEKEETMLQHQNELVRLGAEEDSLACTWKEKKSRYSSLICDLSSSLSELSHRVQIEEAVMKEIVRKITLLETMISEKIEGIKEKDEKCKNDWEKVENMLVSILSQIVGQVSSYTGDNVDRMLEG